MTALAFSKAADALRACSQWLSEWPDATTASPEHDLAEWLPAAWKLLHRGTVIPLSPTLEAELGDFLPPTDEIDEEDWLDGARRVACLAEDEEDCSLANCDSAEEQRFFKTVIPAITPNGLLRHWHHQVPLNLLSPTGTDEARSQRVDFLFSCLDKNPIVVEIDGGQHEEEHAAASDRERNDLLAQSSCLVIRVPTTEVLAGRGPAITRLTQSLNDIEVADLDSLSPAALWLLVGRRVMQIQSSVLYAFRDGHLSGRPNATIRIQASPRGLPATIDAHAVAQAAITDLNGLLKDVCDALGLPSPPKLSVIKKGSANFTISFSRDDKASVVVRDCYLPFDSIQPTLLSGEYSPSRIGRKGAEQLLARVFGYDGFREGQFEAIERIVLGKDTIVLLPTGAGKSAIYQLAGLLRPGLTLVVSPLISLIEDQISNLRLQGVDRAIGISSRSEEPVEELLKLLGRRQYWLCYVAPERFQMSDFRDRLRQITTATPVSLVAVDEVHCVSEWGHDFRPSYLNLARAVREYCAHRGLPPPIIGLTGTASRSVLKDVQRSLEIHGAASVITPQTFDRPELVFEVQKCSSSEKPTVLLGVLQSLPQAFRTPSASFFQPRKAKTYAGLIFCVHVNGPFGVSDVASWIGQNLDVRVEPYGSKPPRGWTDGAWKSHLQQCTRDFKVNSLPLMACTTAFGMGIDKPNIRYSIHYNLPKSIESFYQEAGRTGRNRDKARCVIIYSVDDIQRAERLLSPTSSRDDVASIVEAVKFNGQDDVVRNLYFHKETFTGQNVDIECTKCLIREIGIDGTTGRATVPFNLLERGRANAEPEKVLEQGLQRLVTVGAVSDYTRDYARRTFTVDRSGADKTELIRQIGFYVATYQKQRADEVTQAARQWLALPYDEFVQRLVARLVSFVYEVVERGRRQALSEMLRIVRRARTNADIRREILRYLEHSRYTDMLDALLKQDDAGMSGVPSVLGEIASPLDAAELRAQCARVLNDYPDQPAIRLLLAASEAICDDADEEAVKANVLAAVKDAVSKYGLDQSLVCNLVSAVGNLIAPANRGMAWAIVHAAVDSLTDRRPGLRHIAKQASPELLPMVYGQMVADLNSRIQTIL